MNLTSTEHYGALGGLGGGQGVNAGQLFASEEDLQNLIKAISAGHDTAAGGDGATGFALRPESLERTLKVLTYKDQHVVFWKQLRRMQAFNTIEEYNVLQNYGSERLSAFTSEGALPTADDSSYERKLAKVKFMGTLRAVSHPMGLVTAAHGNVIDAETNAGTLWLMRQIEKALFFADETVNSVEWDGVLKQIAIPASGATIYSDPTACSGNIIDLASSGAAGSLTPEKIDEASETVFGTGNFGKLNALFYGTGAHRKLADTVLGGSGASGVSRINVDNLQGGPLKAGFTMGSFASQFGDIALNPSVFLSPRAVLIGDLTASGATTTTLDTFTATKQAVATGSWPAAATTNKYHYAAVAVSANGNSAGAKATPNTALADTNDAMELALATDATGGQAEGFIIYRTAATQASVVDATTKYYEIARVKADGNGDATYTDNNQIVAGSGMAFAFTMEPDVISFRQLAPFTKIPLAQIDLTTRWAQVMYGMPVVYAPKKCLLFINVAQ